MELNSLTTVSPIDGRYHSKTVGLQNYFSEYALMRFRLKVEVDYFIALCQLPLPQLKGISLEQLTSLQNIYNRFTPARAKRVKEIEKVTNHDVKAIEYYIKECFEQIGLERYKEFIHFGLTSQDINNTAFPIMLSNGVYGEIIPQLQDLLDTLNKLADKWADVAMLARTHGQPASPTRLGKEIRVFTYRLEQQLALLKDTPVSGKFGGATGNFNAHKVAYPNIDWQAFANRFLQQKLGILREQFTTQISNYDNLAAIFDALKRIGTVILDLDRDMWMYISMNYFKQRIKEGEVGSSAMPHKVNPIDFENSEGNLGIANALFAHLAQKLPVSRLQRDLTDSTVIRNIGVPIAHLLIAIDSTKKGLKKLILNKDAIAADLNNQWNVVAEALQTILRREGYPKPYETLKALTRTGEAVNEQTIAAFIDSLNVSDAVKKEMHAIKPGNYTGM